MGGIDVAAARRILLSQAKFPVDKTVATTLITAAKGNPLALSGFVQELSPSQLSGHSSLPDPLPTGQLIEARFARHVDALLDTRAALLLVAAEPSGDSATIAAAASELGVSLSSLELAETRD